jgi:hypothetical protein
MPHNLLQAAYTPEALAAMAKNPTDRAAVLTPVIAGLGGRIEAAYFSFGDYDIAVVIELPDKRDCRRVRPGGHGPGTPQGSEDDTAVDHGRGRPGHVPSRRSRLPAARLTPGRCPGAGDGS